MVRPGKPVPPAAPTPRKPLSSVTDDVEELQLASSSLMPVAEEVKPPPPAPAARKAEPAPQIPPRPPSSAEIVTSAAPLPAPAARSVVAAEPRPAPAAPASDPAPAPASVELSDAAVEQLASIVHGVLESTLGPLKTKQKELEARLETLQKASAPIIQAVTRQPSQTSLAPVRSMSPSVDITGSFSSGAPGPRPSMISTSYGLVSVMPGPAPRPAIEAALERVGPIDVPDFAGKRKFAGGIVIGILILAVVGAILATILSYS